MPHELIDLNADLRKLREKGYNVAIHQGYLVVRDIPYVNEKGEVEYGTLVSSLDLNDTITLRPADHTIRFMGNYPHTHDGRPIEGIRHSSETVRLSDSLVVQHSFSSKPTCGYYENYYNKVNTYASILSGHAAMLDPSATPLTYAVVEPTDEESPFHYIDTASARAEINVVTEKLAVERLAIVGLGGTGSYVLDLLAKTPAKEMHLFDEDKFSSHNAFRAPGAASKDDLRQQPLKVDYLRGIYSRLHKGIVAHQSNVSEANIEELRGMSCVFLCMSAGPVKKFIVDKLEEFGVLFIDVGMGLYNTKETLGGIVRVTTSQPDARDEARARLSFASNTVEDIYDKNIQVADLNALNASLAVIRWKKIRGFYFDFKHERFTSYTIGSNMLLSEDIHEPE